MTAANEHLTQSAAHQSIIVSGWQQFLLNQWLTKVLTHFENDKVLDDLKLKKILLISQS